MTKPKIARDKDGLIKPAARPALHKAAGPSFKPRKPAVAGSPKAAVAKLINQCGGATEVALKSGVNISTAYGWADEACENSHMPFWRVAALSGPAATAAAEYLAARCGGVFLPLPQGGGAVAGLLAEAAREHGDMMAELIAALADGRLSLRERREGAEAVTRVMADLAALRSELLHETDEAGHD